MGTIFGKNGCSTIEVEPFQAICSYNKPEGTTPLTLDVPVISYVPPVPPPECACFEFESDKVDVEAVCDRQAKCSIEIKPIGDCCGGAYKITPHIEVPCCSLPDKTIDSGSFTTDPYGSSVAWKLSMKDCEPRIEFRNSVMPAPGICIPTIKTSEFKITASYNNDKGEVEKKDAEITITKDEKGCPVYTFSNATLDLTGIGSGAFANGGDVNKCKGDPATLRIDGVTESDKATWYGGGLGDLSLSIDNVYRRGPLMRGGDESPAKRGGKDYGVLTAATNNKSYLVDKENNKRLKWTSGRFSDDYTYSCTGNLDIISPTGAQWAKRGIGLTLTRFKYTPAGVLSETNEEQKALLVSPPIEEVPHDPTGTKGLGPASYDNTSGLDVISKADEMSYIGDGLRILTGDGLRVYARGDGKTESDDKSGTYRDEDREGKLEIQYGPSLRIVKTVDATTLKPTDFREYPSEYKEAIEVNFGRGLNINRGECETHHERDGKLELNSDDIDFMFYSTKYTETPDTKSRYKKEREENALLRINDSVVKKDGKEKAAAMLLPGDYTVTETELGDISVKDFNPDWWVRRFGLKPNSWVTRDTGESELVFKVVVDIVQHYNYGVYTAVPVYAYMHFLSNGVLLGVYKNEKVESATQPDHYRYGGTTEETERGKHILKKCDEQ